jgi:TATA-box binding protein (TBP) (component of TFIID and TFIIIB)
MSSSSIPDVSTPLSELKLVTMTISVTTGLNFNLAVIANHIELNQEILSVSFRKIKRGTFKKKKTSKSIVQSNDSEKFKNQCSFDIDIGEKIINTKLFNNGKIINVGCLNETHAVLAVTILMKHIQGLKGSLTTNYLTLAAFSNQKKFFKDELRKKFNDVIQIVGVELNVPLDLAPFDACLSVDAAYDLFTALLNSEPDYEQQIMYIYTVIQVFKYYYDEMDIINHIKEDKVLWDLINNAKKMSAAGITGIFPAYLGSMTLEKEHTPSIVLINKSTNSGYYVNRNNLEQLISKEPQVVSCNFDKNRYPGVIIEFKTSAVCDNKIIKFIFFNTGKINITAANSHAQIQEAYDFLNAFCQTHFKELLLKSEYVNKNKEYDAHLPDLFNVGIITDHSSGNSKHIYLLKKSYIMSNPRNLRMLKLNGYLDKYKI